MNEHGRVSLGAVAVGVVVTFGTALLPLTLGAAVYLSLLATGSVLLPAVVWLWLALSYGLAAFLGGRFAAVAGRALSPRDGGMHGLVTWAAWSLLALGGGGAAFGVVWSRMADPVLLLEPVPALWWAVAVQALGLFASVAGGIRGARSERVAAGLHTFATPDEEMDYGGPVFGRDGGVPAPTFFDQQTAAE